jgi:hypothetical protein
MRQIKAPKLKIGGKEEIESAAVTYIEICVP